MLTINTIVCSYLPTEFGLDKSTGFEAEAIPSVDKEVCGTSRLTDLCAVGTRSTSFSIRAQLIRSQNYRPRAFDEPQTARGGADLAPVEDLTSQREMNTFLKCVGLLSKTRVLIV